MLERHEIVGTVAYMGGVMSVPEAFAWSWGNMVAFTREALCLDSRHVHFDKSRYSLHDVARNEIAGRIQGDWVVMLDTDITFEPDLVARLVMLAERYNVDVLTGVYSFKSEPHYPVLYVKNSETGRNEIVADWDRTKELFQVDSAGAGCLFVRRNVFERITAELGENPFDRIGNKGEDHSFFERCATLGIPVWCAAGVEVSHLEYVGLRPSVHFKPRREPDHFYERLSLAASPA